MTEITRLIQKFKRRGLVWEPGDGRSTDAYYNVNEPKKHGDERNEP